MFLLILQNTIIAISLNLKSDPALDLFMFVHLRPSPPLCDGILHGLLCLMPNFRSILGARENLLLEGLALQLGGAECFLSCSRAEPTLGQPLSTCCSSLPTVLFAFSWPHFHPNLSG